MARHQMKTGAFKIADLQLIVPAPPPDNPPLGIGDYCRLNSGGPCLLVVDVSGSVVTVGWDLENGVAERSFPRAAVRRIERPRAPPRFPESGRHT
jgi:uncharacterized protein YodC (DUF2158 family)